MSFQRPVWMPAEFQAVGPEQKEFTEFLIEGNLFSLEFGDLQKGTSHDSHLVSLKERG